MTRRTRLLPQSLPSGRARPIGGARPPGALAGAGAGLARHRRAETRSEIAFHRLLSLLLSLAAVAHCGRKTDVRPPELVAPEVVEGMRAQNVAEGVRVSWRRPKRYVDGSTMTDLGGFRIERSRDGEAFAPWREEPVSDRERFRKTRRFRVVDTDVETGREYRYRVQAFTLDGHVSAPSEPAALVRQVPAPEVKDEGQNKTQ